MFKFLSSEPLHQPLDAPTPVDETTIKCTTCYMCACRCGIRVHLREGEDGPEVRYIDGNPNHPLNQGCLLYTSPNPRDRTRSRMPSSA